MGAPIKPFIFTTYNKLAERAALLKAILLFKLGKASDALAQIHEKRYYEPYMAGPCKVVLLGVGGFAGKEIQCLWKTVK